MVEAMKIPRTFGIAIVAMMLGQGAALARAPSWKVDQDASHLRFQYVLQGNRLDGSFTRFNAAIRFDPGDLATSSIRVDIPLASVDAGASDRNQMLANAEWFNGAVFPTAHFVSEKITARGEGSYVATGVLEIKGTKVPVSLPFKVRINGDRATAMGRLTINRNRFRIGEGNWAKPDYVGFNVDILIDITARRQP